MYILKSRDGKFMRYNDEILGSTWTPELVYPKDYRLFLKLEETSGTIAYDESSNDNDYTLVNTSSISMGQTGKVDNCYQFSATDSSGGYLNIDKNIWDGALDGFTISAWVKLNSKTNDHQGIYSSWKPNGSILLRINTSTSKVQLYVVDEATDTQTGGDIADFPTDGDWHHVIGWYDGTNLKAFVDNVEGSSIAKSGTLWSNESNVIGGTDYGTDWYINGYLDEVMIYQRALTDDEISQLYNNGKGI